MTDLTRIPVPNEGPITDKVKEIYERSFPPEEQIPLPELLKASELPEVSFVAWADPALPTDEAGAGSGVSCVGEGVVVSIDSQFSRAVGGATVGVVWKGILRATPLCDQYSPSPNNCALRHFHPVVWERLGHSASPGSKGVEE